MVDIQQPLRVGFASLGGEVEAVHRGLANWPAIRPTFTIGTCAAYVSTTAIESSVRSLPWMFAAVTSAKVSAQSPPCSMKASPAATLAILVRKLSHSAANTSGGSARSLPTTSASCWGEE